MSDFDITELNRRLANLLRFGTIAEADYANARVRVQSGDTLTGWLPWGEKRAGGDISWHPPEVGEQVMVLSPSGELNQGLVMGAVYQDSKPAPAASADRHHVVYSDGAVLEYDRAAHHLKALLPAGATLELVADGGITIKGDITLDGNINMTGTLTADEDVVAGGNNVSLVHHVNTGVTPGGGNSGEPL